MGEHGEHPIEELLIPRVLPRGPHKLPRDVVLLSQRRRLLRAAVGVFAESGYAEATVRDVIRRAGVSRTTFYEQFADKEACFLAAYADAAAMHLEQVIRAAQEGRTPDEQLRLRLRGYLRVLAEQPAYARTLLLEAPTAGDGAVALRADFQGRYVALVRETYLALSECDPNLPALNDDVFYAATAAVDELVVRWIRDGRAKQLSALEPTAVFIVRSLLGLSADPPAIDSQSSPQAEVQRA